MDDLSRFCCLNADCPTYGRRGDGNLSVCMRYGNDQRHRLLYCGTCKARFSERKGTPRFDTRLPRATVLAVLAHLAEGCGVRQTARLVGVGRDTATRLARLAGDHARQLHDELVAFSPGDDRRATRREVVVRRPQAEALRPGGRGRLV
jgi:LacI family transcriptional regulator